MFNQSTWSCFRHPIKQLLLFDEAKPRLANLPYRCWSGFAAIAIVGSCVYGGSISLVLSGWKLGYGALLLTLSAGLSWCIFGPILVIATKTNVFTCAHACLVTMAYGESVLFVGALINLLLSATHGSISLDPVAFNIAWVALSNVIMAGSLSILLAALRVPYWKTGLLWMLVLNLSGLVFFHLFKSMLGGGT
jgi:hypothetical protein